MLDDMNAAKDALEKALKLFRMKSGAGITVAALPIDQLHVFDCL